MIKMRMKFFTSLFILFTLSACVSFEFPSDESTDMPQVEKNQECSNLDSLLYQLIFAENPYQEAENLGLAVQDRRIQVLLVMENKDAKIPEGYDLVVGTRSGDRVQVFAPVDQLCDLANTEEIIAVRIPPAAIPQQ